MGDSRVVYLGPYQNTTRTRMIIFLIPFFIGVGVGALIMFLELTVSRKNWVAFREWARENNI